MSHTIGIYEFRPAHGCSTKWTGKLLWLEGLCVGCMLPKLFFERPIVFRCKFCKWVNFNLTDEASREVWLEEEVAFQQAKLNTDDVWWFHTICDVCE